MPRLVLGRFEGRTGFCPVASKTSPFRNEIAISPLRSASGPMRNQSDDLAARRTPPNRSRWISFCRRDVVELA